MSYTNQPMGSPPNINMAFHQSLLQLIDGMTQQVSPFQLKQQLMEQLQSNGNVITNLHQYVYAECARRNLNPNAGIHPQDLAPILHQWCQAALNTLRQQMMAPVYNTGNIIQMGSGMGAPFSGVSTPGNMYSTGGVAASPGNTLPSFYAPPAPNQMQSAAPVSQVAIKKESVSMPERLNFRCEAIDDQTRFNHGDLLRIIESPMVADWTNHRVVVANLKSHLPATSAFDAYRELDRLLPDNMKRGYWAYRLLYNQLEHISLNTQVFFELREQIRQQYATTKWNGVIDVLQTASQGTWSIIDAYLTKRINTGLFCYIRDASHLAAALSIQSITDLTELCDPHFTSSLAENSSFAKQLEMVIDRAMKETFINDTLVLPGKNSVTSLMKCREVNYFEDRVSKFDYGTLEQKEKEDLLARLFAANTVLSVPHCLLATNMLPADEVDRLYDPKHIVVPERQGLLTQAIECLFDNKPMPISVVLNKYRVPPTTCLNIVQSIYPMETKAPYLVGSNQILGW